MTSQAVAIRSSVSAPASQHLSAPSANFLSQTSGTRLQIPSRPLSLVSAVVGRQFYQQFAVSPEDVRILKVDREPTNEFDPNAVLVLESVGPPDVRALVPEWNPIGYLPGRHARLLSPLMDVGLITSIVLVIPGDDSFDLGDAANDTTRALPVDLTIHFSAEVASWLHPRVVYRSKEKRRSALSSLPSAPLSSVTHVTSSVPSFQSAASAFRAGSLGGGNGGGGGGGGGSGGSWTQKGQHERRVTEAAALSSSACLDLVAELSNASKSAAKSRSKAQKLVRSKKHRQQFTQRSLLIGFGSSFAPRGASGREGLGSLPWSEDIPDPVLWHVFSVPGLALSDLLLSVRLVCRRWRDLVDVLPLIEWRRSAALAFFAATCDPDTKRLGVSLSSCQWLCESTRLRERSWDAILGDLQAASLKWLPPSDPVAVLERLEHTLLKRQKSEAASMLRALVTAAGLLPLSPVSQAEPWSGWAVLALGLLTCGGSGEGFAHDDVACHGTGGDRAAFCAAVLPMPPQQRHVETGISRTGLLALLSLLQVALMTHKQDVSSDVDGGDSGDDDDENHHDDDESVLEKTTSLPVGQRYLLTKVTPSARRLVLELRTLVAEFEGCPVDGTGMGFSVPKCFRSSKPSTILSSGGGGGGGGGGGAGSSSSSGRGVAGLLRSLSPEQLAVVAVSLSPTSIVVVKAFAGSGKTTTLRALARSRPDKKFLYLAFNVTVRDDAQTSFSPNVSAKTIHQLAFASVGRRYPSIADDIKVLDAAAALRDGGFPGFSPKGAQSSVGGGNGSSSSSRSNIAFAAAVVRCLNLFIVSGDGAISDKHIASKDADARWSAHLSSESHSDCSATFTPASTFRAAVPTSSSHRSHGQDPGFGIVDAASYLWVRMKDDTDTAISMTLSGMLKLWTLSRPDLSMQYDCILLDEAQDASRAVLTVLLRQRCARVLVGDPHQAIYAFAGASDAFSCPELQKSKYSTAEGSHIRHFSLTHCYRFAPAVAEVANTILSLLKSEQRPLVGASVRPSKVTGVIGQVSADDEASTSVRRRPETRAVLARMNATLLKHALHTSQANGNAKFWFLGTAVGGSGGGGGSSSSSSRSSSSRGKRGGGDNRSSSSGGTGCDDGGGGGGGGDGGASSSKPIRQAPQVGQALADVCRLALGQDPTAVLRSDGSNVEYAVASPLLRRLGSFRALVSFVGDAGDSDWAQWLALIGAGSEEARTGSDRSGKTSAAATAMAGKAQNPEVLLAAAQWLHSIEDLRGRCHFKTRAAAEEAGALILGTVHKAKVNVGAAYARA